MPISDFLPFFGFTVKQRTFILVSKIASSALYKKTFSPTAFYLSWEGPDKNLDQGLIGFGRDSAVSYYFVSLIQILI